MRRFIAIPACMGLLALGTAMSWADAPSLQPAEEQSIQLQELIESGRRCGSIDDAPASMLRAPSRYPQLKVESQLRVPVAFHIIYKEVLQNGRWVRIGDVSNAQLDAQIAVLNAAFAGAGISFTRASVDRTKNGRWFNITPTSSLEREMKHALAIDPAHTLNFYILAPGGNFLGWAYYPWSNPETHYLHGVEVLYSTLPGGSARPYNLGDTGTHEVGHYFGLLHTFEGGCYGSGDYVADTPSEASPAYGCPGKRNTCASPGMDPVENFMDYTDDACMNQFTPMQRTRMRWATDTYRPALVAGARSTFGGTPPSPTTESAGQPALLGAVPNPFNPTTSIIFSLPSPTRITLRIYDVAGRQVATLVDGDRPAGRQSVVFEGRGLASGVYMAVLRAGDLTRTQRLLMLQ